MKYLFAFVLMLSSALCWGGQKKITDWMATHYLTKDGSRLREFWDRTAGRGALKVNAQMREKLIGFFGAAFRDEPALLQSRIKAIPKEPGVEQDGIALILWWSDQEYARRLLREAGLNEVAETPVPGVGGRRILVVEDVDFLYGWYCATGDTDALQPLSEYVAQADWTVADEKADYAGAMIAILCGRDVRGWDYVKAFVRSHELSADARKVFAQALKSKPANQSPEPTAPSGRGSS